MDVLDRLKELRASGEVGETITHAIAEIRKLRQQVSDLGSDFNEIIGEMRARRDKRKAKDEKDEE
jgi:hypothetical protein